MFQGSWKCSQCGGEITELPFQPRSEKGLTCRACFMKQKSGAAPEPANMPGTAAGEQPVPDEVPFDAPVASEPQEDDGLDAAPAAAENQQFTGDWKCSVCGGPITSLPFQPRSTENLKCLDCFKQSKG